MKTVTCPHCKKPVTWSTQSPFRPFCSERCRIIDLGDWADGSYVIPTTITPEDSESISESIENDPKSTND